MKKRFGFLLEEELHQSLKARAELEETSMSAICRHALRIHLRNTAQVDTSGPGWAKLKRQVRSYLDEIEKEELFQELDDFLGPTNEEHDVLPIPEMIEPLNLKSTYSFPVKFGPAGLCLHGFHHPGIERCTRPFQKVELRYDPRPSDPWS